MDDFRQRILDAWRQMVHDPRQQERYPMRGFVRMNGHTAFRLLESDELNGQCVYVPDYGDENSLTFPVAVNEAVPLGQIRIVVNNLYTYMPAEPTAVETLREIVHGHKISGWWKEYDLCPTTEKTSA